MQRPLHCLAAALAVLTVLLLGTAPAARAAGNDIVLSPGLLQGEFKTFVEEVGLALAYNPVAPAKPRGITGFDVGVSLTLVKIDDSVWNKVVSDGSAPSNLPVPRLHVQKGLPFGIDVGLSYIQVPGSNATVIGGEVRKAILEGSTVTPAVSVVAHYSRLNGVSDLDLWSWGLGLGISKGFAMFTPYAGVDEVWVNGSENSPVVALSDVSQALTRAHVGLRIALLPILNVVGQADFAKVDSYTLRLNLGF
jgi:opacity protein-like surface antigen